ncbi:MAG TPA: BON domain-containing protein [Isosphaeraceae bacterium]|nr:BON domain-containing protein [Isosphaeraceae bacterium]
MHPMARPDVDRETAAGSAALPTIHLQVEERLRQGPYLALRDVSCLARDGVIYLHGCLPSYHLKQIAQELAAGAAGVGRVVNRIEVSAPSSRTRPGRETSAHSTRGSESSHDIPCGVDAPPRTQQMKGVHNDVGPEPQAE